MLLRPIAKTQQVQHSFFTRQLISASIFGNRAYGTGQPLLKRELTCVLM